MLSQSQKSKFKLLFRGTVRRSVLTPGESGVRQGVGFPGSGVRRSVLTHVLTLDPHPWNGVFRVGVSRGESKGHSGKLFRTPSEMLRLADSHSASQPSPPGSADPSSESSRIHASPPNHVHGSTIFGPTHPNVAQFVGLEPFSVIEQVQKQQNACQLHLRERPPALFGQLNSPRHCFVPSFGWPASVDPRFGHDKMFAGELPKPASQPRDNWIRDP